MREKILTFIEKNSRIDLKELAIILGVDEASVVNELQKMEEEHIICGYHTLIDWDKTSEEKLTALVEVKVTPQRGFGFDKVAERIYNYAEVDSVYLISGGCRGRLVKVRRPFTILLVIKKSYYPSV